MSASSGEVTTSAPRTSSSETIATASSGTASRTDLSSRSMSVVPRETRSPVPARSSTPVGSATERTRKSSRRSASTRSPSTAPRSRDHQVKADCTASASRYQATATVTVDPAVPVASDSTRVPSTHGPTSPATVATVCSPTTAENAPRWRRASTRR